jgi:hypothetical protein
MRQVSTTAGRSLHPEDLPGHGAPPRPTASTLADEENGLGKHPRVMRDRRLTLAKRLAEVRCIRDDIAQRVDRLIAEVLDDPGGAASSAT